MYGRRSRLVQFSGSIGVFPWILPVLLVLLVLLVLPVLAVLFGSLWFSRVLFGSLGSPGFFFHLHLASSFIFFLVLPVLLVLFGSPSSPSSLGSLWFSLVLLGSPGSPSSLCFYSSNSISLLPLSPPS